MAFWREPTNKWSICFFSLRNEFERLRRFLCIPKPITNGKKKIVHRCSIRLAVCWDTARSFGLNRLVSQSAFTSAKMLDQKNGSCTSLNNQSSLNVFFYSILIDLFTLFIYLMNGFLYSSIFHTQKYQKKGTRTPKEGKKTNGGTLEPTEGGNCERAASSEPWKKHEPI